MGLQPSQKRYGSHTLCCALVVISGFFWTNHAYGQGQESAVSDARHTEHSFDIPAQPLNLALKSFAWTAGLQMSFNDDLAAGLTSTELTGRFTSEQGLERLLGGSGLTHRFTGPDTVIVERNSSAVPVAPLAVAGAAGMGAAAAAAAADSGGTPSDAVTEAKPVKVPEITVKDVRQRGAADLGELPPEYAGGDLARGGRVGVLGNRDIMDTPFTQMNYTSKIIQDQQARYLGDVLRNDPSVQLAQQTSTGFLTFSIRGFQLNQGDMLFNGLAIAPTINGTMMTESIERVEVLRGPNALLNGAAPGGSIGGMVNLVPKRAGDEALTQLTAQYISDTQFGGHADISRRFGKHKEFGIRINGVYRTGDLPIDHSSRESALATVGLDYRGDIFRVSADFGYQQQDMQGARRQFNVASDLTAIPEPPSTRTNANQPWELNDTRALYGTLRGEVDVTKQITAFADFGMTNDRRQSILLNRQLVDSQGTLSAGNNFLFAFDNRVVTLNAGLRSVFDTGPVHHRAVLSFTQYSGETQRSPFATAAMPASNIYNPVLVPGPPSSLLPSYGTTTKINETDLSSGMFGDTLSILDERVQLTGGVRFQQIKVTNFNQATGAVTDQYDKSAPTPMLGLVIKPWQHVSLYGNYIEGLQQGPTAPVGSANAGEVFAPFKSNGYEAGVKADFGRIITTLAAFQITQPSAFINPATNVFSVDGQQRNRGVEFSVFGEVMDGLRLLGGTSYIDAELTKTESGINQGNKATVAPFQLTFYGEWDLPFLKALTMTSRVTHASSQYVNFENTQEVPGWTQWDLGARYRFERSGGKPITMRAFLENVLDNKAWNGSPQAGQIFVRDPRTFYLSATFDF
ncbi:putative tonB-dependent receptor protein [Nitrospira japonica]|uniref:Putative tonB-dependent receptor protein n=1 Tax=Nitrospira japonica TaxID=1325564 RepID=A0A1W1IBF8_9BACT|nr:TonB-dependent receptor [Nitrospira japonica]SLM50103.1 putative tonB-dependent receptor protein [Nitrospira japonica]